MDSMSENDAIVALEARVAQLESIIAALTAQATGAPQTGNAPAAAVEKTMFTPGSVVTKPTETPNDNTVNRFGSRVGGAFDQGHAITGVRTGLRS